MTKKMTGAEYLASLSKPPASKGRVRGTQAMVVDGIKFHSKLEGRRYINLKARANMGLIQNLRRQVPIVLQGRDGPLRTPTGRPMQYLADFAYIEQGREIVEDAKGHQTDTSKMKLAILAAQGIVVRVVKTPDAGLETKGMTDRQLRDLIVGKGEQ